jgi:hypothetical protein
MRYQQEPSPIILPVGNAQTNIVDIGIGAGGNMPSLHKDPKNPHALVVEAPYDQEVLASLKAIVPSTDRTWDPNDKVWLISSRYGQAVANILKARWLISGQMLLFPCLTLKRKSELSKWNISE